MQPWFTVYFFDSGHPFYDLLFALFAFHASLLLFGRKGPVIDAHSFWFHFGGLTKTSEYMCKSIF